jgi:hypothetical protein
MLTEFTDSFYLNTAPVARSHAGGSWCLRDLEAPEGDPWTGPCITDCPVTWR